MLVLVGGQTHNQVWDGLVCSLIDRLDLRSLSGVLASTSPPMDTPKLQLFTEQLLIRKAKRLAEKIFYN